MKFHPHHAARQPTHEVDYLRTPQLPAHHLSLLKTWRRVTFQRPGARARRARFKERNAITGIGSQ